MSEAVGCGTIVTPSARSPWLEGPRRGARRGSARTLGRSRVGARVAAPRAPRAGPRDLPPVPRRQLLVLRPREEDVRPPRHLVRLVEETSLGRDEVALQLDLESRLLERLAQDALDEVLAAPDASARCPPEPGLEERL